LFEKIFMKSGEEDFVFEITQSRRLHERVDGLDGQI
jgi:hypothetical protein